MEAWLISPSREAMLERGPGGRTGERRMACRLGGLQRRGCVGKEEEGGA